MLLQEASASDDPPDAQEGKAKPGAAEPAADATANGQADSKYGLLSAIYLLQIGTLVFDQDYLLLAVKTFQTL